MSTAKLLGNVRHLSNWVVRPLCLMGPCGFSKLFRQNVWRITLWIWFFPDPWSGRDLNNYSFGDCGDWHDLRNDISTSWGMMIAWWIWMKMTCIWLFWHSQSQKPRASWPRVGRNPVRVHYATNRRCLGSLRKKTSTELVPQPGDMNILENSYSLSASTNFAAQKDRKETIILSSSSRNCLGGCCCRCCSCPRSLWDLAMARIGPLNHLTSCAPGTAKTGTENGHKQMLWKALESIGTPSTAPENVCLNYIQN